MSTDNDTPEDLVEETGSNTSPKDKFLTFINEHQKTILVVFGGFLFILFLVLIYSVVTGKSSIDEYADKFCSCADEAKSEFYNYSKDDFGYRSDLSSCFAEEFKAYGEGLTKLEKKKLLLEFRDQVVQKCPQKLANIFEYK